MRISGPWRVGNERINLDAKGFRYAAEFVRIKWLITRQSAGQRLLRRSDLPSERLLSGSTSCHLRADVGRHLLSE
ncbi:Uncharacterised protein [Mycobacteroides abscessus subsp. abscessus]|nr:Uncharacterised protein [Mycobacteroides abscessus subsp. abscessus]SHX73200.1 Uncharacterised protein [Mycobacteroides abscessus subsp. abscessus]SIG86784.1 Uncharacterised protein [Mycobacteroides abscessus subsp. abscessus]SKD18817.1 Uncharacterised protein [Mycobacteroides abscessus subsp. abscessus]SKN10092.1 Uncharacterised protein [Mycobacteroides abscessus subsp. abscessus]